MKLEKIFFIINPKSGQEEPILNAISEILADSGAQWDAGVLQKDNITQLIQRARDFEADIVCAYGGDGTIASVAKEIYELDMPLCILPGGTVNAISKGLELPQELDDSLKMLSAENPKFRAIDLGFVNDECFLIQVTMGYANKIIENTSDEDKSRLGKFAYYIEGIKKLGENNQIDFSLVIDGEKISEQAFMCMICNSGNLGAPGVKFTDIDISDGLLDVLLVKELNMNSISAAFKNSLSDNSKETILRFTGQKISLRSDPPQSIQYDGELLEADSYEIEIKKQALKVLVSS